MPPSTPPRRVARTIGAASRLTLFTLQHPPDTFDNLGRLLDRYVRDQARFHATPALRCAVEGASTAPLDAFEALHLFRIAQEGLQNALRHACATTVRVRLARESSGTVVLTIADDGAFRAPDGTGHGLATMQSRADEIGAALTLEARPAGRTSRCGGLPTTDPVCAAGSPEQAKRRPRRRPVA